MTRKPKTPAAAQTYAAFGQRLRWARELIYTQLAFAQVMGVDKSTINKIEKGERALSFLQLINAGEKLRTGVEFLMTGELRLVDNELLIALVQAHPELLPKSPDVTPRRRAVAPRAPTAPAPVPQHPAGKDIGRRRQAKSRAAADDSKTQPRKSG